MVLEVVLRLVTNTEADESRQFKAARATGTARNDVTSVHLDPTVPSLHPTLRRPAR